MQREYDIFLRALKYALQGHPLPDCPDVSADQWQQIFRIAREQKVLPLIFQAVYSQSTLRDTDLLRSCRSQVRQSVYQQAGSTMDFLALYRKLRSAGVDALVVKGIICRSLYPNPDQRPSGDEDLLIPDSQFETAHRILLDFGMEPTEKEADPRHSFEISYRKKDGPLHIELHRSLFSPESGAYGHLNTFFEDVHQRAVKIQIQDLPILTMAPTDHLFYLICHAFKHFLHSGFGIRQVCDIVMLANHWGSDIDWLQVLENCQSIRAGKFAATLFRIGEKYLLFDPERACYPACLQEIRTDEMPMLTDLLESGIYGSADTGRRHSGTITLTAAENRQQGKHAHGLVRSLFPPARELQGRYPYLKKAPALLPLAWASRIASYGKEAQKSGSQATDSIRIGSRRVALMKQYGILDP